MRKKNGIFKISRQRIQGSKTKMKLIGSTLTALHCKINATRPKNFAKKVVRMM